MRPIVQCHLTYYILYNMNTCILHAAFHDTIPLLLDPPLDVDVLACLAQTTRVHQS